MHVQVAVKVIRGGSSNEAGDFKRLDKVSFAAAFLLCVPTRSQNLLREAELWSRLNHPNITPFYGISFDLGRPDAPCLICPYFKNGNVAKYLKMNPRANRLKLVRSLCNEMSND